MKKAIFTIMIGRDPSYPFAYRTFKDYANKVGADLIRSTTPHYLLDQKKLGCKAKHTAWFEKIYIRELLKDYDRVLYVDADILITPDAPDIFSACPDENKIYMLNEGRYENRDKQINQILSCFPLEKPWPVSGKNRMYLNAGVMLISKKANLLSYVDQQALITLITAKVSMYEQTYFNYLVVKHELNVGELPPAFNRMSLFGEDAYLDNHFIHYAGGGFCRSLKLRYRTFIQDYQTLYNRPAHPLLRRLQLWKADVQFVFHEIRKALSKF